MGYNNYLTGSIKKYVNYMKQEGLSKKTINSYVDYVLKLSKLDSRLYRLSNEDIQNYILESKSESAQNCKINALKKYFKVNHPEKRIKVFIRPTLKKQIIEILTIEEVWSIINKIKNTKQKAIITGIYLHGLRISEILNLRYENINRKRGLLIIKQSKFKKDRLVPLHDDWIKYLTDYSLSEKHKKGYSKPIFSPYSETSIGNVIKNNAKKSNINKRVYPHLLRDCYASHLIESGYDTSLIQEILGHEKIETTRKYIHFTAMNISKVKLKIAV